MKNRIVKWIQNYFDANGKDSVAVIGISGGTDSSVAAALCVEALGKDRVIGVLMPQGEQHDIDAAWKLIETLNIRHYLIPIGDIYTRLSITMEAAVNEDFQSNYCYRSNTPARIRMTILYGISALYNGRVVNTCNLSEDYIGYSTKFGDAVGDFSPLAKLTKTEVKEVGRALNLPKELVDKAPEDGLSGKTDEDNFGFTYDTLDKYLRTGEIKDLQVKEKIERMHRISLHKLLPMPSFNPEEGND